MVKDWFGTSCVLIANTEMPCGHVLFLVNQSMVGV